MKMNTKHVREISINYKGVVDFDECKPISSSEDAFEILIKGFNFQTIGCQEQLVILYLNQSNKPLGVYKASQGGITGTVVDIRLILAIALKGAAVSLIMAHNHPSGQLKPSLADESITQKLKSASELMDLKVLDHLIVSPDSRYFSFADEGIL